MGLRKSFWIPFFGVPQGPLGGIGARMMPSLVAPLYPMMAGQLALQPDDDLLDVGCGSARLLQEHASQVHHVAGLDASEIQVGMARHRLADRIATGTAEVAFGNATALPWDDGTFSVVSSLNCLKFVPDPPRVLREMHRVLRGGGRVVLTLDDEGIKDPHRSGMIDAYGQWQWSADDARHMMEEAGFADVTVTRAPTRVPFLLLRGVKRPSPQTAEIVASTGTVAGAEAPVLAGTAG